MASALISTSLMPSSCTLSSTLNACLPVFAIAISLLAAKLASKWALGPLSKARTPRWLAAKEKSGAKREEFLIKRK